jgi:hypothetical protein
LKVSGSDNPQLVRSNLFFAGLLFSGESHVWIDFDFGFFSAACRWSDIADMKRLKIPEAASLRNQIDLRYTPAHEPVA